MTDASPVAMGAAAVVELAGGDAVAFAHSQFSSDVAGMATGTWQMSAWLDAQGRARNVFLLLKADVDRILAWLPRGNAGTMARELARYVFRARVSIDASRDWRFAQSLPEAVAHHQLRASGHGWQLQWPGAMRRSAILQQTLHAVDDWPEADACSRRAWRIADIEEGLPWLEPDLEGVCTATSLGLARFAALSTSKGCYPGQEIVARLHFRGGNKRHLWKVRLQGTERPAPGLGILADTLPAFRGVLLHAERVGENASIGLAVLPEPADPSTLLRAETGEPIHVESREFAHPHESP